MRVAIVGSRECGSHHKRMTEVLDVLRAYGRDVVVISGAAPGMDTIARRVATALELDMVEYPADWDKHGKRAGFLRNQTIVDDADIVHAWTNGSPGTADTIRRARKAGKPVVIHEIKS